MAQIKITIETELLRGLSLLGYPDIGEEISALSCSSGTSEANKPLCWP